MEKDYGDMPHLPQGFHEASNGRVLRMTDDWTDPAEMIKVARLGGLGDPKIFI
jgi:hypothetical protein